MLIEKLLTDNNIKFISQYKDKWLGRLSLDFYLPDYNIAIECQGIQHFEPVEIFGGEIKFKQTVERDIKKKQLCEDNKVKLLYFTNLDFESFLDEKLYNNTDKIINEIKKYK